jgi:hypothetical protein
MVTPALVGFENETPEISGDRLSGGGSVGPDVVPEATFEYLVPAQAPFSMRNDMSWMSYARDASSPTIVHDITSPMVVPGRVGSHPIVACFQFSMGGAEYLTRYEAGLPVPSSICVHVRVKVDALALTTRRSDTPPGVALAKAGSTAGVIAESEHAATESRAVNKVVIIARALSGCFRILPGEGFGVPA